MKVFILRTVDHAGQQHNVILGTWYAATRPGFPAFERVKKESHVEVTEGDKILLLVQSSNNTEIWICEESCSAAYVMTESGSTFECLYS